MRSSEEKALNNIHTYIIKFIIEIRQATDANESVVSCCWSVTVCRGGGGGDSKHRQPSSPRNGQTERREIIKAIKSLK